MSLNPKPCRYCKKSFQPKTKKHIVCSDECAIGLYEKQKTKQLHTQARMERKELRERKLAIKPWQKWFDEAKEVAQLYARLRDYYEGCISCPKPQHWHGQWHGSHFRPAGNFKAIALNTWNIHKACSECNNHKSGNQIPYQDALIKKIGLDKVEWLKAQNHPYRHSVQYLARYKKVMGKRCRILKKRLEAQLERSVCQSPT